MSLATQTLSSASHQRVEVIAIAVLCSLVIFELVRRRRLLERYALLWLFAGATILVLGIWRGLLTTLSHAAGIYYPPSALFAVGFVFVLVLLVHFTIEMSRLSDRSKILAQRLALQEERLGELERGNATRSVSPAEPGFAPAGSPRAARDQ